MTEQNLDACLEDIEGQTAVKDQQAWKGMSKLNALRPKKQLRRAILNNVTDKNGWHTAEQIRERISKEFHAPLTLRRIQECLRRT